MNQRLEQYLGEAEQKLQGLPSARRQEELEEIRQHSTASVQAREEIGIASDTATEEVIQQFGEAQAVSRGLQSVWWREQIGGPRGLWKTAALAIGLKYAVYGLLQPLMTGFALLVPATTFSSAASSPGTVMTVTSLVLAALPSTVAGVILGKVSPRNAVAGAAVASGICLMIVLINVAINLLFALSWSYAPGGVWQNCVAELVKALFMIIASWLTVHQTQKRLEPEGFAL